MTNTNNKIFYRIRNTTTNIRSQCAERPTLPRPLAGPTSAGARPASTMSHSPRGTSGTSPDRIQSSTSVPGSLGQLWKSTHRCPSPHCFPCISLCHPLFHHRQRTPGMLGQTPITHSPAIIALVLWQTYKLNASACVLAQQGELLQATAMPSPPFIFFLCIV